MKEMINAEDSECPFEFNFDATRFKPGDVVSYRVPEAFDDMPFVGELLEVHEDYVVLRHYQALEGQDQPMRGSREDRPIVSKAEALKD